MNRLKEQCLCFSVHWVFVEFAYTFSFWFMFTELLATIHFKSPVTVSHLPLVLFTSQLQTLLSFRAGEEAVHFVFLLSSEREVVCKSSQEFALYHIEISSWYSYCKSALLWTTCYRRQHCHLVCCLHLGACFLSYTRKLFLR